MICLHLYDSLFRSSLPFTPPMPAPPLDARWLEHSCARLARYEQLFSERMADIVFKYALPGGTRVEETENSLPEE